MKQTYENYHRLYFQSRLGKEAHKRANVVYRQALREQYGEDIAYNVAQKLRAIENKLTKEYCNGNEFREERTPARASVR